jgi:hypothetical protein
MAHVPSGSNRNKPANQPTNQPTMGNCSHRHSNLINYCELEDAENDSRELKMNTWRQREQK